MPWAWARTGAGAGEWAGARAIAITRAREGAIVAVVELWAGDRALTWAVFLIAVPGPGWRWRSLCVGRRRASWKALGGILVTAGRFFAGLLQPFIQLPLGRRGVIRLEKAQREKQISNISPLLVKLHTCRYSGGRMPG